MNKGNFDENALKPYNKTWKSSEKPGTCWKQRIQTQTWRCGFVFFTVCQQKPLGLLHVNTCSNHLSPSMFVAVDWDYNGVSQRVQTSYITKTFACFHAPCPCRDCRNCSMTCGFTNWPCARPPYGWEVTRSEVGGEKNIRRQTSTCLGIGNHSYLTNVRSNYIIYKLIYRYQFGYTYR